MAELKIAIVHDWLTNMGGAERVVLALHEAFPDAPIYTSVYEPSKMPLFDGLDVRATKLQKWPAPLRKLHKFFPVLRVKAFRALDLSEYDIVISSSSAESKQVNLRPDAIHICYCHTPIRYYWSHYDEYLNNPGFGFLDPLIRLVMPFLVRSMRVYDLEAVKQVDHFIANSTVTAARIKQFYNRDSTVIFPPVDINRFLGLDINGKREGFIALGRQVPYKRIDLAVQACTNMNLPLTVYGDGSEHKRLEAIAGPTVKFVTDGDDKAVAEALAGAQALISPQEEDFGIVPLEAAAAGCPAICFDKGGARDTVVEGKTGAFFSEQTVESVEEALNRFENYHFDAKTLQDHAKQFSNDTFIAAIKEFVATKGKSK
jgi:glycosyltransferase involved in cell wall biosynthesis